MALLPSEASAEVDTSRPAPETRRAKVEPFLRDTSDPTQPLV